MCWSPKIKTPTVKMPQQAQQAAPISQSPTGIQFGDSSEDIKTSDKGIKSVTVDKTPDAQNQNNQSSSTNFGSPVPTGSQVTSFGASASKRAVAASVRR